LHHGGKAPCRITGKANEKRCPRCAIAGIMRL
jgi:hypothetical protein